MSKQEYISSLKPYRDVIIFVVTLFIANYAWKYTVTGDENGDMVSWFGLDITAPFEWMACHIANVVYELIALFRNTVYMVGEHTIRFQSGNATTIIWGCTALKQMFIWLCLILTVRGGWKHKIWYIPVGWVCCYLFNILPIVTYLTLPSSINNTTFIPSGVFPVAIILASTILNGSICCTIIFSNTYSMVCFSAFGCSS